MAIPAATRSGSAGAEGSAQSDTTTDRVARIKRIIELQLGLLEDQRDLAEVITVNLRQSSSLLKQYAAPLFMEYIDVIAGLIREGQKQGAFRKDVNARVAARSLFGALDAILLAATDDGPEDIAGGMAPMTTPLGEMFMFTIEGGELDTMQRRELLDWVIRPALRTVDGVADVNVAVSFGMTLLFLAICTGIVIRIFRTGYKLRN